MQQLKERRGRSRTDDDYGEGEACFEVSEELLLDEKALSQRIVEVFRAPGYVPPQLPSVGTQLIRLSQSPDADIKSIVRLLQSDPMLAGECLKQVQSVFYSRGREVTNLETAVVRLGLKTLHGIVMSVCMNMRVFRTAAYAPHMERIRRHSQAVARLSELFRRKTSVHGDDAVTAGLLHDVGMAGILLVLGDVPRGQPVPDLMLLWPAIHRAHAEAGSIMTRLWDLPQEIARVTYFHHQVTVEGRHHPLSSIVTLADDLASELGMDAVEDGLTDRTPSSTLQSARDFLGLDDRDCGKVRDEAEDLLARGALA
ncbi:MAG: HDOD domain-containing protein [Acidobacteriota bacterium]